MRALQPPQTEAPGRGASVLSGLIATATTRRRELRTRFIIAGFGAGVLWHGGDAALLAAAWFAAVIASQYLDFLAWSPFRQPDRVRPESRTEMLRLYGASTLASAVYSFFPAMIWFLWGAPGKIFATIWLCGALLHVTLHMHHERRTFLAAAFPHALYFFALPGYALMTGAEPGRAGAAAILLAAALYVAHLLVAFRQASRTSETMRLASEHARERQVTAEEASLAKSAFLANMSHEIRTPMNGVLGMAEALGSTPLTPDQAQKLKVISESGELLMTVLNDILDLSKIEAGRIDLERAPFRPAEIARRLESLHSLKAREKGVDFRVECEGDAEAWRLGDAHRILQILHNLVGNAIKFTERGGVTVRLAFSPGDPAACFEVADTGIGLAPEQARRIFEPFAQADATTTRRYGGTGLGLTVVKGLVETMGGAIRVESAPGTGARFIVTLPLPLVAAEAGAGAPVETPDEPREQMRFARRLHILAAEDNAVNRAVLQALLAPADCVLVFAEDGYETLAAFRDGAFDVVLMDISMPGMDGVEALRLLRAVEAERGVRMTPVIAVSAHAMRQEVDGYLAAGFDGYVTKPVDAAGLVAEIARVIGSRAGVGKTGARAIA